MTPPTDSRLQGIRRRAAALVLWTLAAFWVLCGPATAATLPNEYQLKATLLFNFVKFTEWPASAFTHASAPLVIGVLGEDPFGPALDGVVRGESVRGRKLILRRFQPGDDLSPCHLLFVARSEKERLPDLWKALLGRPVLTVGDTPEFCENGGMINLAISAAGTVRPEIDPGTARAAGLEISSKLLSLPMVRLVKSRR